MSKVTRFNVRTSKKVVRRRMSAEELCKERTIYPTLVVLRCKNGATNHSVTVVDDLIFDSTQSHAMKLCQESLDWICSINDGYEAIHAAYRFNGTEDPPKKLVRKQKTNWKANLKKDE